MMHGQKNIILESITRIPNFEHIIPYHRGPITDTI
jgi:hypothetical protein